MDATRLMQVGISQVNSDGCYYVVRNQVDTPGSKTCTDICSSFKANIGQSPNGGNGISDSASFFQCYQCYGWRPPLYWDAPMAWPCPQNNNPKNPNGITVSLDGVNVDPVILAVVSTMNSDCTSIYPLFPCD